MLPCQWIYLFGVLRVCELFGETICNMFGCVCCFVVEGDGVVVWVGGALLDLWYVVLVCHQYDVCENYFGSVYIGGYGGLSESGLCVFHELWPVSFHVVVGSL